MQDLTSKNYITLNFNNIANMQIDENKIICYIDDGHDTRIEIII